MQERTSEGPPAPSLTRATSAMKMRTEIASLGKLAAPIAATFISQSCLTLASFSHVGKLGPHAVAGLGLGISVCNITGSCVFTGLATGIDTLCSQASGAGYYREMGEAFGRGTLVMTFVCIPVALLWYNMEALLSAAGQHDVVAHLSGEFCRAYLWGMLPLVIFENLKRCLQAQEITTPSTVVSMLGILANILFHHFTCNVRGMGVYGAGLALSMTVIFMLFTLLVYIWVGKLGAKDCWSGACSSEIFKKLPAFLQISLVGLAGTFMEWTSIEATLFLAGLIGDNGVGLATHTALLNAYAFLFPIGLAISVAATVRVGYFLGASSPHYAQLATISVVQLAAGSSCFVALSLGLGRSYWSHIFGATPSMLEEIEAIGLLYASVVFVDQMQIVCTGILKGMALQHIQAIAAGIAFWGIGVPVGAYLALGRSWGVKGFWCGLAVGEVPLLLAYLWVLFYWADWERTSEGSSDDESSIDNYGATRSAGSNRTAGVPSSHYIPTPRDNMAISRQSLFEEVTRVSMPEGSGVTGLSKLQFAAHEQTKLLPA